MAQYEVSRVGVAQARQALRWLFGRTAGTNSGAFSATTAFAHILGPPSVDAASRALLDLSPSQEVRLVVAAANATAPSGTVETRIWGLSKVVPVSAQPPSGATVDEWVGEYLGDFSWTISAAASVAANTSTKYGALRAGNHDPGQPVIYLASDVSSVGGMGAYGVPAWRRTGLAGSGAVSAVFDPGPHSHLLIETRIASGSIAYFNVGAQPV